MARLRMCLVVLGKGLEQSVVLDGDKEIVNANFCPRFKSDIWYACTATRGPVVCPYHAHVVMTYRLGAHGS